MVEDLDIIPNAHQVESCIPHHSLVNEAGCIGYYQCGQVSFWVRTEFMERLCL